MSLDAHRRGARQQDPFGSLDRLLAAVRTAPLPPLLFISGDDEWIVGEARRRVVTAFREAFREGEVSEYDGVSGSTAEAIADASTVALFSTNRLVTLEASELLRARKVTAEELDGLLDEVAEADERAKVRLALRARALLNAAGIAMEGDAAEAARRLAGRVKRADRAPELEQLLLLAGEEAENDGGSLDRLLAYVTRASSGDNTLLVTAVSPEPEHRGTKLLASRGVAADFAVSDDPARADRLAALGLERAIERRMTVEAEVFETLTSRGRLTARAFLSELDRLIDTASGNRVTAESAARLIVDERKEYGSDFVDAVVARQPLRALSVMGRLLTLHDFTSFRPFGEKGDKPAKKGPKGESAFFPLFGLLASEIRRMVMMKAALVEREAGRGQAASRRVDYRTFVDRVLPALKAPRPGAPPLLLQEHPFVLHRAYLACQDWSLKELSAALAELHEIDRGVKTGTGSGKDLLEGFLLKRAEAGSRGSRRVA